MEYFDTKTPEMRKTERFVEGSKAGLVKDTSYKGLGGCRLRCGSSENRLPDVVLA